MFIMVISVPLGVRYELSNYTEKNCYGYRCLVMLKTKLGKKL
jgi:hypothetical protein